MVTPVQTTWLLKREEFTFRTEMCSYSSNCDKHWLRPYLVSMRELFYRFGISFEAAGLVQALPCTHFPASPR